MCLSLTEVGKEGDLVFGAGEAALGVGGPRFWYPDHWCLPKGLTAVVGWECWREASAQLLSSWLFLANVTSGNCSGALP